MKTETNILTLPGTSITVKKFENKVKEVALQIARKQEKNWSTDVDILELLDFLSEMENPFIGGGTSIVDENKNLGTCWVVGDMEACELEMKINNYQHEISKLAIKYREAQESNSNYIEKIKEELDKAIELSYEFETNIYFIYNPGAYAIKIGKSNNVQSRMNSLATGSPGNLKLLYTCPARKNWEKMIHEELDKYRMRGEWFEANKEVFKFILWFKSFQEFGGNSYVMAKKDFDDDEYYKDSLNKLLGKV